MHEASALPELASIEAGELGMTFKIEPIRKRKVTVPPKPRPAPFEEHGLGLLITGYSDGGYWLFSPTGRSVTGALLEATPDRGWAIAGDRLNEFARVHFFALDPARRDAIEISELALPRWNNFKVIDRYDDRHVVLVVHRAPAGAGAPLNRLMEVITIDLVARRVVNRFETRDIGYSSFGTFACEPNGWVKAPACTGDMGTGTLETGFVRFHPFDCAVEFEPFPHMPATALTLAISPSGRHVVRADLSRLSVRDLPPSHPAKTDFDGLKRRYGISAQLWSGHPMVFQRHLVCAWQSVLDLRRLPGEDAQRRQNLDEIVRLCAETRTDALAGPAQTANRYAQNDEHKLAYSHWTIAESAVGSQPNLFWQDDEAAFWWNHGKTWICVGLDGTMSQQYEFEHRPDQFTALPGRRARALFNTEYTSTDAPTAGIYQRFSLDGSSAADPFLLSIRPPFELVAFAEGETKRQRAVQLELTHHLKTAFALDVAVGSESEADCILAIDAITAKLAKGLASYRFEDNRIKLRVCLGKTRLDEQKFFAHIETLGSDVVPSLRRLVEACTADPDLWSTWSGELDEGRQAFAAAAKALARLDAKSWRTVADYACKLDSARERYFIDVTLLAFAEKHGWCEESFDLAVAFLALATGNSANSVPVFWQTAIAPEAMKRFTPAQFADRMIAAVQIWPTQGPAVFGHANFDAIHQYSSTNLQRSKTRTQRPSAWETAVFAELKKRAGN